MKFLGVRVPGETWAKLKATAKDNDLSLAQLVRRILKDWLAKQETDQ